VHSFLTLTDAVLLVLWQCNCSLERGVVQKPSLIVVSRSCLMLIACKPYRDVHRESSTNKCSVKLEALGRSRPDVRPRMLHCADLVTQSLSKSPWNVVLRVWTLSLAELPG
jgi:hypothetical protein